MTTRTTMMLALVCAVSTAGCAAREQSQAAATEPAAISQTQMLQAYAQSYRLEKDSQFDASEQSIRMLADRGDDFAQLRQAWLAYQLGDYKLATARYSTIVTRYPNLVEARLGLMLPLMAQKRWQDAAVQARAVLSQYPGQYIAHLRLLRCEEAMQQWDVVDAHATEMIALYPSDPDILIAKARARAGRRQVNEARDAYAVVLTRKPDDEEAQLYLKAHP